MTMNTINIINVGDVKKIMMNTGEVVPPNNSNALIKALRKLINERNNSSKKWNLRKMLLHCTELFQFSQ